MPDLRRILEHTVTQFDVREEKAAAKSKRRGQHNIYALGIYLGRVDDVIIAVDAGTSIARALHDSFSDRLLTCLEKACGVAVTYGGGAHDTGRPA